MSGIAFVMSGQGAQFPGMGKQLYECSQAARNVFLQADELRPGTSRQCFEGTEEELRITENTQPCLYTVSMAAAAALLEAGIRADMAAGFSLGELGALTYAGAFDLKSGLEIVSRRGQFMQEAAAEADTAMAAVMKLTNEEVEAVCAGFKNMYPVNYNCPGQVTVAGPAAEMKPFMAAVREAGGRAIPVKVSGAFHTPYMQSASVKFDKELAKHEFAGLKIPVYSNYLGDVYTDDIRGLLVKQIVNPVKWETIVRKMIAAGADTFIELGAGHTLCNLIRKTDNNVRLYTVASKEDIDRITAEV